MNWPRIYPRQRNSKSVALLAVFSAMVVVLEVYPIVGITDLKLVPEVPAFTIDWTGIPIMFVLFGLGFVYSFVSIAVMGIAIGYRNPVGATFKVIAESLTVIGFFLGARLAGKFGDSKRIATILGLVFAMIFRAVGMMAVNGYLLAFLYGMPLEASFAIGIILIPWNALQAAINIVGGVILYKIIPENLLIEAGLEEEVLS